jgi:hypothetical protein
MIANMVRTSRIESAARTDTDKPVLAARTPDELEVLHKLVLQAERLGYLVTLAEVAGQGESSE